MTTDELATKLAGKLEFMIKQYLPKPTCATKQAAHSDMVREVKRLLAEKLYPPNHGLTIEIKV
jgi:hypothetical protein